MLPLGNTGVSVISDVDDTIKISEVSDKNKLLENTLMKPFEAIQGMATAYARWGARAQRSGVASFDSMIAAVDFPNFVRGLIEGVFGAIVNASIEQVKAYAGLVKQVSDSVDQFVEAHLDDGAARDWLAESFPDLFCIEAARLVVKVDAKAAEWSRLNRAFGLRRRASPADLKRVVQAARRRLARGRQQQLATMLMMGINRIVATGGKIGARATQRRALRAR